MHEGEKTALVQPNIPPAIESNDFVPGLGTTHGADSGITLRHGEHRGRLLLPARVMPGGNARQHWPLVKTTASHGASYSPSASGAGLW